MTLKSGFYLAGDFFVHSLQCFLYCGTLPNHGVAFESFSGLVQRSLLRSSTQQCFPGWGWWIVLLGAQNRIKPQRHQSFIHHNKSRFAEKFATSTSQLMANILKGQEERACRETPSSRATLACPSCQWCMGAQLCARRNILHYSLLKSLIWVSP